MSASSDVGRRCTLLLLFAPTLATEIDKHVKKHDVVMCSESRTQHCCGDSVCNGSEDINNCLSDCPGVTTTEICGEEPHSDRGGRTLTFGVGHRATSAQDCCDKCTKHSKSNTAKDFKGCNSWTFCGYPACWGLDTGWNHTFGEWCAHKPDRPCSRCRLHA